MKNILLFFVLLLNTGLFGQGKYWIYFRGKPADHAASCISAKATLNRALLNLPLLQFSDLPVNPKYIDSLRADFKVAMVNSSKWLNAITAYLDPHQLTAVARLGFVTKIEKVSNKLVLAGLVNNEKDSGYWPLALRHMHAELFNKMGLTGKGVTIGVIDGRFKNVAKYASLKHIVEAHRILGMRNFANLDSKEFLLAEENSKEGHCPQIVKLIGGFNEEDGSPVGLSPDASFYLARTEVAERELRVEEDFWILGLEWLDSLGVRLVNSSIGYAVGFEKYTENHKVAEIDGMSTQITKAAQVAAKEKGMILVLAAGNEGDNVFWKILTVPADAQNVITVGAVDEKGLKQDYSSIGPRALPYLKPDLAVFSSNGTSFAAPVITGLIGCMLQKDPTLTSREVLEILKKSGQLYPYGNNYVGYGVPDVNKILRYMDKKRVRSTARQRTVGDDHYDYKVPKGVKEILIFSKEDKVNVIRQELKTAGDKPYITIEKKPKVVITTIIAGSQITELTWK